MSIKKYPGLVEEARLGAKLGFTGKQIIHPAQVEPVQEAFTPDQEAIDRALSLIQAFRRGQSAEGVVTLDGKMVEAPMIRAAERVLVRNQGSRPDGVIWCHPARVKVRSPAKYERTGLQSVGLTDEQGVNPMDRVAIAGVGWAGTDPLHLRFPIKS
jgi:hypothetical protein